MTGLCPVLDCGRRAGSRKLMCGLCWLVVPPVLQRRVQVAYWAWLRDTRDPTKLAAYKDAAADAIEAV